VLRRRKKDEGINWAGDGVWPAGKKRKKKKKEEERVGWAEKGLGEKKYFVFS